MIDGTDMLVISAVKDGAELARVPCSTTPLDKKASGNEIRTTTRDGAQTLGSVRFKGEMVAHSVVS